MNKRFFISLFLALSAYGQQTSVAVLPSDGAVLNAYELEVLTDKMREAALKVLPANAFVLLKQDVVVRRLGGMENYIKECTASSCIVDLGKKAQVDYVAQASVGKLGSKIRLKVELYNVRTEGMIGMLNGEAEDVRGLLAVVEKRVPAEVFGKIPGASVRKISSPSFAGGISGLERAADYELDYERRYLVNLSTEPSGAVLSFDGVPVASCGKTPCKAELPEGSIHIAAALEQYETAGTTVSITRNNQSINIKLKPNFGILEIKPAYADGVGKDKGWNLTINGKAQSSYENRLLPGEYDVKLSHECYEDISFKAGINKSSREVFDMASNTVLKKGGLDLSVELDGEPVSEPVYVNGKLAGETPFTGSVPICAKVEIGENREMVDVEIEHNEKVKHIHKSIYTLTDSRDGKKYRTVKIGEQTWMAENLNYYASGSVCYDNDLANCEKYGRLYDWETAMDVCPSGWHLPNKAEWDVLETASIESKYLKFAAMGGYGYSVGSFSNALIIGDWWSASMDRSRNAYYREIINGSVEFARWHSVDKNYLFSVRCLQGPPPADYELDNGTFNFQSTSVENGLDKPKNDNPFWTSSIFWSIAAVTVGAVFVYAGYLQDKKVVENYEYYASLPESHGGAYTEEWNAVESAKNFRNGLYIAGGLSFALGVWLWF